MPGAYQNVLHAVWGSTSDIGSMGGNYRKVDKWVVK